MPTTVTRLLAFDAAHRVMEHQGRCRHLHGHRYSVEITVSAPDLNELGMVVDFGVIKEKVGQWIDDNLDHNCILREDDPILEYFRRDAELWSMGASEEAERTPFVMPCNPTAENLAALIAHQAATLLNPQGIGVDWVRVWETPNCCATYSCR